MHDPVLVVGTGRSGTSVIARLLQTELGIDMGGPGWLDKSNRHLGDYEDPELKGLGVMRFEGTIGADAWRGMVRLVARGRGDALWGYKDPNIHWFLRDWLDLFPRAPVIWAWRDPVICAKSCERWYGWPVEGALAEMQHRVARLSDALGFAPADYWGTDAKAVVTARILALNMNEPIPEDQLTGVLDMFLSDVHRYGDDHGDE